MKHKFIALLVTFIFFSSCKKNGLGGDATVVVFLKHHGRIIKNHIGYPDTVFVKFKATDLPGTTPDKFDTYFVGEEGEDHIHCVGLKPGKYYFYGVGMDSAGPYRVNGGVAIKISWSQRKKEIDTDLAVSE
ncbi:MAG: hypothetical protein JWO32_2435 [Bacteroidetes bacterium]|nr:hypothetical protein [Bacteroidota bacterium]